MSLNLNKNNFAKGIVTLAESYPATFAIGAIDGTLCVLGAKSFISSMQFLALEDKRQFKPVLTPTNEAIACLVAASLGAVGNCVLRWAYNTVKKKQEVERNEEVQMQESHATYRL